ncbi:TPA: hypothetical protein J0892_004351 [Escherichia coli]|nr:hypothetical protein [Escherichia coli]HBB1312704.1 hypothetical protein [Escherichia coli]
MKLVQLVLLCSCFVAGGVRAAEVNIGSSSESLSSASVTLDTTWLSSAQASGGMAQVYEWNLSGENQHDGCGFMCSVTPTPEAQKASHMAGLVGVKGGGEQTVKINGSDVKVKVTLNDITVHGALYRDTQKVVDEYLSLNDGSEVVRDSGAKVECLLLGCTYKWVTGVSGGKITLSMGIPDKVGVSSFTVPELTIATVTSKLYSDNTGAGVNNEISFVYTGTIKLPALTINLPERCYTGLSGTTITFKSDIDASTVTADGGAAVDSRSITLNATCNTVLLSKSVYASVKLVQQSGVDDGYKFKLNPKKNEYNLNRYLSVVAKHVSSGAAGGTNCGKDTNTFEDGKLYNVGQVAFPGRPEQSVRDPYNITFNLCAFRPEGTSDLLPPGEHTGAIRVITRFYAADE